MRDEEDGGIDPDQIRTLLAVADQRSFTKAAATLNVHQSAISHQVRRIETKLGRPVFRRDRNDVGLTTDGEAVLIYARAMAALTEDMQRYLRNNETRETIRIGMNDDFARTALPNVLGVFILQHPRIEIEIVCSNGEDLFAELDAGRVDIVIARRNRTKPRGETLWTDRMVWVGRADFPLPIADPVPLVLPPSPSGLWAAVLSTLRDGRRTWRIPFQSWSLANQEAALRAGLGVSAFPRNMELLGLAHLGDESGLPALADVTFVLDRREDGGSACVEAFCAILRSAALFSFKDGAEPARAAPAPGASCAGSGAASVPPLGPR